MSSTSCTLRLDALSLSEDEDHKVLAGKLSSLRTMREETMSKQLQQERGRTSLGIPH